MARKKKWTRTGWIGWQEARGNHGGPFVGGAHGEDLVVFYQRKGSPHQWCPADWPPVRVRVTVEVIE